MRIYKTKECKDCPYKGRCTRNPKGRIIYRWEHEEILEEMDIRVKQNKNKVKMRQWLIEHVFGTIKRSFNQGYFLLKGIKKVDAETGLSVLAYNIKRVINIIGLRKLIMSVRGLKIDYRRCEIEG